MEEDYMLYKPLSWGRGWSHLVAAIVTNVKEGKGEVSSEGVVGMACALGNFWGRHNMPKLIKAEYQTDHFQTLIQHCSLIWD